MKKKILCMLTVVVLMLSTLCACSPKASSCSLSIDGNIIPVGTLLKVNGNAVSLFEYRYYYVLAKETLDGGDDAYWDSEDADIEAFDELVMDNVKYYYALKKAVSDLGLKLSSANKKNISTNVKNFKKNTMNGMNYKEYLDSLYMDEYLLEQYYTQQEYYSVLREYYFGEGGPNEVSKQDVVDYVSENYHRYKQIYIRYDYDGTETNKQFAYSLVDQLENGADFDVLMNKYTRDPTASSNPNGYYAQIIEGSTLTDTLSALEINGISGVKENEHGYFIYKRLDMDNDVYTNLDTFRENMELEFISSVLQAYVENADVQIVSEYYNSISFETLLYEDKE